jgi:hypothetical protein
MQTSSTTSPMGRSSPVSASGIGDEEDRRAEVLRDFGVDVGLEGGHGAEVVRALADDEIGRRLNAGVAVQDAFHQLIVLVGGQGFGHIVHGERLDVLEARLQAEGLLHEQDIGIHVICRLLTDRLEVADVADRSFQQ